MPTTGYTFRNVVVFRGDNSEIMDTKLAPLLKEQKLALTFLDPPFNQNKDYESHNDRMNEEEYWDWMKQICSKVYQITEEGGSIYFMQREKNSSEVLECLRQTGWTVQNLIIWKKKTSAVPQRYRYGKQYQIIAFATKGLRPRVFNRLRIDYPLMPGQKQPRENGIFVTDVWDDIREMTSGFFAGDEALRDDKGARIHKQQSPIALLLRIILSSTLPGDIVFDPFAGTGTTLVVANQLGRTGIGIELGKTNFDVITKRLISDRPSDKVSLDYYRFTGNLDEIAGLKQAKDVQTITPTLEFVEVLIAEIDCSDWSFSGRKGESRRTPTASILKSGTKKLRNNPALRNPDYLVRR